MPSGLPSGSTALPWKHAALFRIIHNSSSTTPNAPPPPVMQPSGDHPRVLTPTSTLVLLQRVKAAQRSPNCRPPREPSAAIRSRHQSPEVRRNFAEIRRRYTAVQRIETRMPQGNATRADVAAITKRLALNRVLEVTRTADADGSRDRRLSRPRTAAAERLVDEEIEDREEERLESRCASALPGPQRKRLTRRAQSPRIRDRSRLEATPLHVWSSEERVSRISDSDLPNIPSDEDTDIEMEEELPAFDRSGQSAYVRLCTRSGIVPANYFIRHMTDERLIMSHHGLGPTAVRPICAALMSNSHVRHLDISDNFLGRPGGLAVVQLLHENCFIAHVCLNANQLDKEVAEGLAEVMSVNPQITHLELKNNFLDDTAAEALAQIIANTVSLEFLDLSHNQLGDKTAEKIGESLVENTTILELNLSWNHIRSRGAKGLAKALTTNTSLLRLNLGWNALGPVVGVQELGKALRVNVKLEEIDLSNNRINPEGAVLFGKGLSHNTSLKKLTIGRNPLQSAGCFAIVTALMKNPDSQMKAIQFQNIWTNQDFRDLLQQANEIFPELKITTGLFVPSRPKARVHPLIRLLNYRDKHDMKLIDFFKTFDKNGDMTLSHDEFLEGMKTTGLHFTSEDVAWLIRDLDKDGDGEINYSELVMSKTEFEESQKRGKLSSSRFTSK